LLNYVTYVGSIIHLRRMEEDTYM